MFYYYPSSKVLTTLGLAAATEHLKNFYIVTEDVTLPVYFTTYLELKALSQKHYILWQGAMSTLSFYLFLLLFYFPKSPTPGLNQKSTGRVKIWFP
jgi:formate hydrogenlyase subunit 3/multisubunit Na+/H+ antiporter MnhD subunit